MQNKEKNSFIRLYIKYIVLRPQIAIFPVKISILSFGKIGVKSQYISVGIILLSLCFNKRCDVQQQEEWNAQTEHNSDIAFTNPRLLSSGYMW